jgi:hypothetical protein
VGAVAERFALRLTTAAQSHQRLVRGQRKGIALGIDHRHRSFDHERSIRAATYHDIGHVLSPSKATQYGVGQLAKRHKRQKNPQNAGFWPALNHLDRQIGIDPISLLR